MTSKIELKSVAGENRKIWRGVFTALVSPMKDAKIDFESFEKLVEDQISQKIAGFVINGTTGESPTLHLEEIKSLVVKAKQIVAKVRSADGSFFPPKIIVGVGSNSTEKTVIMAQAAEKMGVDALLVVVPYYNKPPQKGLVQHFKEVAKASSLPMFLYNVPGRTQISLSLESILDLSSVRNIVGIKEATGDISFAKKIREICHKDFVLLSGDDGTFVPFVQASGDGIISVCSHLIGAQMNDFMEGVDPSGAKYNHFRKFIDLLYVESNPIPVKMACHLKGLLASPELRLPLVELSNENRMLLETEMKRMEIL